MKTEKQIKKINIMANETIYAEQEINDNEFYFLPQNQPLGLFDTVVKDHILSFSESRGLALEGTYVYKTSTGSGFGYNTFYEKCLEEKSNSSSEQIILGDNSVTIYKHPNGHIYYDIDQKGYIDEWYKMFGNAWYYGVDETNQRIFLPRKTDRVLVEKKEPTDDDPSWYNLYSDGYYEEGGFLATSLAISQTIVLQKEMANSSYEISLTSTSTADIATAPAVITDSQTTTGFTVDKISTSVGLYWSIKGYVAIKPENNFYTYIVVGNTEIENATITTSEYDYLNSELDNKADVTLSNINASQSAKEEIVSWAMPDYSTSRTITSGWIAEYDCIGYCECKRVDDDTAYVKVNDAYVYWQSGGAYPKRVGSQWLVPKGSTVTFSGSFTTAPMVYKLKGV